MRVRAAPASSGTTGVLPSRLLPPVCPSPADTTGTLSMPLFPLPRCALRYLLSLPSRCVRLPAANDVTGSRAPKCEDPRTPEVLHERRKIEATTPHTRNAPGKNRRSRNPRRAKSGETITQRTRHCLATPGANATPEQRHSPPRPPSGGFSDHTTHGIAPPAPVRGARALCDIRGRYSTAPSRPGGIALRQRGPFPIHSPASRLERPLRSRRARMKRLPSVGRSTRTRAARSNSSGARQACPITGPYATQCALHVKSMAQAATRPAPRPRHKARGRPSRVKKHARVSNSAQSERAGRSALRSGRFPTPRTTTRPRPKARGTAPGKKRAGHGSAQSEEWRDDPAKNAASSRHPRNHCHTRSKPAAVSGINPPPKGISIFSPARGD